MHKIKFTEGEFAKLALVTGVSSFDLQKLYACGMLNYAASVRNILIYEFERQKQIARTSSRVIIQAIANKYGMEPHHVRHVINAKMKRLYYCEKCGKEIPYSAKVRNEGLCDDCLAREIIL